MKWCFGLFVGEESQMLGRGAEGAAVGGYHGRETVGVVDVAF